MRARRREGGVTLAELSVVVAILGILSTMAVPNLNRMLNRSEAQRDVEELLGQLKVARSKARSELIDVSVEVSGRSLLLTPTEQPPVLMPFGERIGAVQIGTDDGILTFQPTGGTPEMNPTQITITTALGDAKVVVIYPAIGAMRVRS